MTSPRVHLQQLPGEYDVVRLPAATVLPSQLAAVFETGSFISITRTPQELSVVCPAGSAPPDAQVDGPWVALYAGGPIPFGMTGVVTSLVSPLSAVGCPVFVVSTYDGDVLMVPSADADRARAALLDGGHVLA